MPRAGAQRRSEPRFGELHGLRRDPQRRRAMALLQQPRRRPHQRPVLGGIEMRRLAFGRVIIESALGLAILGCTASGPNTSTAADADRVLDRFIAKLTRDVDLDYTPLEGVQDAANRADLIVLGTVTGLSPGIAISGPSKLEGLWNQMVTLEVRVLRGLSGDAAAAQPTLAVQVFAPPSATAGELSALVPSASGIFVLDDITDWSPFPGAIFDYPAGLVKGDPIFTPFVDGVIFDSHDGPRHLYLREEEGDDSWTGRRSVPELATLIEATDTLD